MYSPLLNAKQRIVYGLLLIIRLILILILQIVVTKYSLGHVIL